MARSLWLADVLADAYRGVSGVRFEVYPGWQTRGRDGVAHRGVINHHTGRGNYDPLLAYMAENSSIAPLCNIASSHDGSRVTLVAAGKANHAGRGHLPWTGTDRGNWFAVGWEAQNDGAQTWPGKHLETIAIGNAALLRHMGQGVDRLADHKTYAPGRKVDRHTLDVPQWRARVHRIMHTEEKHMPNTVILVPHTDGVSDSLAGLTALATDWPGAVLTMDPSEAKAFQDGGSKVYAFGRAARDNPWATPLAGENRKDTLRKVAQQFG